MKKNKTILVIDWLDVYGGAERVAKYLHQEFKFDKVYTLTDVMSNDDKNRVFGDEIEIKSSFIQLFGKSFRYALPLFPLALKTLKIKEENSLIISISHSIVKGISFPKSSTHISYLCARNLKYVWDEKDLYFVNFKKIFLPLIPYFKSYDLKKSKKPSHLVAASNFISEWASKKYNRKVSIIYSPVDVDKFEFQEEKSDFYISVGRLEPYKRYDLLIDVFNENGKKLIIVGDGSLLKKLKQKANKNIIFKGFLYPEEFREYLKKAKAFVFCGKEDFGIALIEPQVCGTPVIAFGEGGALDTIQNNKTGILFEEQTVQSLQEAILKFEKCKFNASYIRDQSLKFSIQNFKESFRKEISL